MLDYLSQAEGGAPALLPWDYENDDQAAAVQAAERRVDAAIGSAKRSILEIGAGLEEIKGSLSHGDFGPWIDRKWGMSERAARNYMQLSRAYGSNPGALDIMGQSVALLASAPSTPPEARAQIEEEARERKAAGSALSRERAKRIRDLHVDPPPARVVKTGEAVSVKTATVAVLAADPAPVAGGRDGATVAQSGQNDAGGAPVYVEAVQAGAGAPGAPGGPGDDFDRELARLLALFGDAAAAVADYERVTGRIVEAGRLRRELDAAVAALQGLGVRDDS